MTQWRYRMLLLALPLLGCARESVPVSGTVTLDGRPLANVNLGLRPENGDQFAVSLTDAEGRFSIAGGLKPGQYKVAVSPNPPPFDPANPTAKPPSPIPAKYTNPKTTPLKLTIPPPEAIRLELTSEP